MQKRRQYLANPATLVSLVVAIFWFWIVWWTLNSRVNQLEEFKAEVNIVELQRDIQDIKTNVAWLTKLMTDYIK